MSYQERLNRVSKLKEWGCEQAHDLISFYDLSNSEYENLKRSVKNYISRAMDISFFDDDEKVKEIFTALYEKAIEGDVRAAEALLDRMYGKASQKIESKITTETPLVITLTDDKSNEQTE
jgi:hypothetical protein